MSYASNDIHGGGSGANAEPSMEEILASIRRILKEDEPGKPGATAPAAAPPMPEPADPEAAARPFAAAIPMPQPAPAVFDDDDDVLLLDASMIARPAADYASATTLPASSLPAAAPAAPPPGPEPLHFSSEPAPFSRDFELGPRAMPEPVVELPAADEAEPEPFTPAAFGAPAFSASQYTAPPEPAPPPGIFAEPEPAAYRPLQPPYMPSLTDPAPPQAAVSAPASIWQSPDAAQNPVSEPVPASVWEPHPQPEPAPEADQPPRFADPPPAIVEPEPNRLAPRPEAEFTPETIATEPVMNDAPIPGSFELPESLISDKTTDAAASSIGALVRSMTTEKSVAITKLSSVTIEDIVREEIRPLLKSWLDTHLPTLVERVVRSEIERVINRSVV